MVPPDHLGEAELLCVQEEGTFMASLGENYGRITHPGLPRGFGVSAVSGGSEPLAFRQPALEADGAVSV